MRKAGIGFGSGSWGQGGTNSATKAFLCTAMVLSDIRVTGARGWDRIKVMGRDLKQFYQSFRPGGQEVGWNEGGWIEVGKDKVRNLGLGLKEVEQLNVGVQDQDWNTGEVRQGYPGARITDSFVWGKDGWIKELDQALGLKLGMKDKERFWVRGPEGKQVGGVGIGRARCASWQERKSE